MRTSKLPSLVLLAALIATFAGSSAAQSGDEAGFRKNYAEIQGLLDRRKWKQAESALRELLREHAGADYARTQVPALREDLRRAAFWKDAEEPDAKSLITGRLARYSPSSGAVRLVYTPETLGDFEQEGATYLHPMHFSDDWTVEIEGDPHYVANSAYLITTKPNEGYILCFGVREEGMTVYSQHYVQQLKGRSTKRLAVKDLEERKSKRKSVKAKISVGRDSIRMSYDGRKVLEVEKPEPGYGSLALVAMEETGIDPETIFDQIIIDGKIDRGWIGGLQDEAVSSQRAEFDGSWEDPPEFASWTALEPPAEEERTLEDLFGQLEFVWAFERPQQKQLFDQARGLLGKGRVQAASTLEQSADWPDGALPEDAVAFLRFNCALELGRFSLAVEELDRLEVTDSQELDRDLLRAELLLRAGRLDEAYEGFDAISRAHPDTSLAYARAAQALLFAARPEEARGVIQRGREAVPSSPMLRELEVQIVKASKGPAWERVFEEHGTHFTVRSDTSRKLVRQAHKVLDAAWEECADFFGPLPEGSLPPVTARATPHSLAFVFSGEGSYLTYVQGVADPGLENTLGIYSSLLKQIAVWNQPTALGLWDTLRHETAHRYLDLLWGERTPRWLNEGLAEAFAAGWKDDGTFEAGGLRDEALARFSTGPTIVPIAHFMTLPEEKFIEQEEVGYAQAWALVHFLRFESTAGRPIYDRLCSELDAGAEPSVAIERAVEGVDMNKLQREHLEWLNKRSLEYQRGG